MSIEKDIRFIAESIEWQNKLLASIVLNKDSDSCGNESEPRNDQSSDNKTSAD